MDSIQESVKTMITMIGSMPMTRPIMPGSTMMGRNATMLVRMLKATGLETSRVPRMAACMNGSPS